MASIFHYRKQAKEDFFQAFEWYEEKSPGKGADFAAQFSKTLYKIADNPETYRKVYKDYRKINFEKFPYYIIYRLRKKTIYILAIYHNKRDNTWKKRVH